MNDYDVIVIGGECDSNRRKTQEPRESSTSFESVVIVAQLTFSLPLHLPRRLGWCHADLPSSVGQPFSAAHFFGALLQALQKLSFKLRELRRFVIPDWRLPLKVFVNAAVCNTCIISVIRRQLAASVSVTSPLDGFRGRFEGFPPMTKGRHR